MRYLLSMVLILTLLFGGLSGCGDNEPNVQTPEQTQPSPPGAKPKFGVPKKPKDKQSNYNGFKAPAFLA